MHRSRMSTASNGWSSALRKAFHQAEKAMVGRAVGGMSAKAASGVGSVE